MNDKELIKHVGEDFVIRLEDTSDMIESTINDLPDGSVFWNNNSVDNPDLFFKHKKSILNGAVVIAALSKNTNRCFFLNEDGLSSVVKVRTAFCGKPNCLNPDDCIYPKCQEYQINSTNSALKNKDRVKKKLKK